MNTIVHRETLPASALGETRDVLVSMARRGFGKIAPERIADHVLRMTPGADWPVHKAALEALKRR